MKEHLRFPGVPVYMNGRNYFIPSLSTRQYRENAAALEDLTEKRDDESDLAFAARVQDTTVPVIGLAIRRNYPDITDENLFDWLDLNTYQLAWKAVQNSSGMTPVTEGEELPAAMDQPTGTGSTVA